MMIHCGNAAYMLVLPPMSHCALSPLEFHKGTTTATRSSTTRNGLRTGQTHHGVGDNAFKIIIPSLPNAMLTLHHTGHMYR